MLEKKGERWCFIINEDLNTCWMAIIGNIYTVKLSLMARTNTRMRPIDVLLKNPSKRLQNLAKPPISFTNETLHQMPSTFNSLPKQILSIPLFTVNWKMKNQSHKITTLNIIFTSVSSPQCTFNPAFHCKKRK